MYESQEEGQLTSNSSIGLKGTILTFVSKVKGMFSY